MEHDAGEDTDSEGEEDGKAKHLSKTKLRKLNRLTVAELKQLVDRPDVVEVHDVTAADPKLLVHLKAYRNTVPVPRHWLLKRKYVASLSCVCVCVCVCDSVCVTVSLA